MRSTLFRIPYEVGGVPLFGFGILLAVWAVVAAVILVVQVRRRGWNRETWSQLGAFALVGAFIYILPRFFPEGMPIRGYGLMVLLGVVSGIGLAALRTRQVGLNPDVMISLCMWMIVAGIVGARLFYVIQYWEKEIRQETLRATLLEIVNFPGGGLVIYGALLAGAGAFFYFNWRHRLPPLAMGDLVAPGVALGIAFGRLGCFLNGCCFGDVCDFAWAVRFPQESTSVQQSYSPPYGYQVQTGQMYGLRLTGRPADPPVVQNVTEGSPAATAGLRANDRLVEAGGVKVERNADLFRYLLETFKSGEPLVLRNADGRTIEIPAIEPLPTVSLRVHPTQLYSAINAGLLTLFLWLYYPFGRRDGETGALLMVLYSVGRFLLEELRTDEAEVLGTGMTISQNVSVVIFIVGVALFAYLRTRPPQRAFPAQSTAIDGA